MTQRDHVATFRLIDRRVLDTDGEAGVILRLHSAPLRSLSVKDRAPGSLPRPACRGKGKRVLTDAEGISRHVAARLRPGGAGLAASTPGPAETARGAHPGPRAGRWPARPQHPRAGHGRDGAGRLR